MTDEHAKSKTAQKPETDVPRKPKGFFKRNLKKILTLVAILILVPAVYAGYIYAASPAVIRTPTLEHYHFRMQILVNGKAEDFGSKQYQTDYVKGLCTGDLAEQPIHFHDGKDQLVHIHWDGMTGGMVMKYYGWNYIGGMNNTLGYQLDDINNIKKITTHGNTPPAIPKDATLYVYTGDENGYKERTFEDWKNQDLETFFGTKSNLLGQGSNKGTTSLLDKMFPKASAHGSVKDNHGPADNETEQEKLTRINNLLGNVVIFAQKDKPTDQQIKDRFSRLLPLEDSSCGG